MRAGKKAIGSPHAPAGRTHAVQCVGSDYVRMYYVPACVSLAMCVTATVTMAAMAACSYICSRRLRKSEGANRRSATQTQRLTGAAAGSIHVHTNTSTAATVGIARIGKGAPKKGPAFSPHATSHLKREQGTEAAPPRNSIQFNSKHPRHVSITHHASRITHHATPIGRHQPKSKGSRDSDPRRSFIRGTRRVRGASCPNFNCGSLFEKGAKEAG